MTIRLIRDNTKAAPAGKATAAGREPEEITKAVITRLAKEPLTGSESYVQDSEVPGFKLRRTVQGNVFFLFHARIKGGEGANKNRLVKRVLGRAAGRDAITVTNARAKAVALRRSLGEGVDPADELRAKAAAAEAAKLAREEQRSLQVWTPAYALEHMLEWRASRPDASQHLKPETIRFYRRGIETLGSLAKVPIVDLKANDIRKALDKVSGKAQPAKTKRALSGVIAHTIKRLELNIPNPVSRLDRGEFKAPPPRETYIEESEIGGFIHAIEAIHIVGRERDAKRARDYMLLTLLYGTRKNELMKLQWEWIDWEREVITIPETATKQKRAHYLPLTGWTRAILDSREAKRRESPYVFPGEKPDQPLTNIRRSLGRAVGEDFKLHDARRTLITHCTGLGINGTRLKAIVGHARVGVTEKYDQREIEQVRRDLTTYHDWLKDKHFWHGMRQAFPDAEREAAETSDRPQKAEQWPGVGR